jgi:hypothetical protein
MFIEALVIEINYLIPFLTLLLGGLIGNWLALGRDKRKEHNAVVLPLKQKVLAYIDLLKVSEHLSFSEREVKTMRGIISERKYKVIQKLYNEFINLMRLHEQVNEYGSVFYSTEANLEISNKLKEIKQVLQLI